MAVYRSLLHDPRDDIRASPLWWTVLGGVFFIVAVLLTGLWDLWISGFHLLSVSAQVTFGLVILACVHDITAHRDRVDHWGTWAILLQSISLVRILYLLGDGHPHVQPLAEAAVQKALIPWLLGVLAGVVGLGRDQEIARAALSYVLIGLFFLTLFVLGIWR